MLPDYRLVCTTFMHIMKLITLCDAEPVLVAQNKWLKLRVLDPKLEIYSRLWQRRLSPTVILMSF